jgi:hypothetical protein
LHDCGKMDLYVFSPPAWKAPTGTSVPNRDANINE